MIGAGLFLFALVDKPGSERGVLLAVLLIGALSGAAFRRLQGGQEHEPAPMWLWCVIGFGLFALAWSILTVFNHVAEGFDMTLWQMLRLLYNGSPN
jgi:tellurite resistance protein TehA-like permease